MGPRVVQVLGVATVALASMFALEGVAAACSGCPQTSLWPVAEDTHMPANALGVAWGPHPLWNEDQGNPVLVELGTMDEIPLEFVGNNWELFLVPTLPLEPGLSYRFEVPPDICSDEVSSRILIADEPVEIPLSLGTISASEPDYELVSVPASDCSQLIQAATVDISLELAPELAAIEPLLMYETWIGGARWYHQIDSLIYPPLGESWKGRGVDTIFHYCADEDGGQITNELSSGPMTVEMIARFPGAPDMIIASNEIVIELDCPGAGEEEGGDEEESGEDTGDTGETTGDSGETTGDSGETTGDPGETTGDSGETTGDPGEGTEDEGGGATPITEGCACSTGDDPRPPLGAAIFALLVLPWLRPKTRVLSRVDEGHCR